MAVVTFVGGLYYFLEFILPPQFGGDFDHARLADPDVQTEGGRFLMSYVGFYGKEESAIGLATSDDGQTWRKWPRNPVLRPTSTSSFDARGMASPSVMREADGTFTMFYIGHGADAVDRVGRATSPDGRRWRKAGVVLDLAESLWMKPRLTAVCVHREGGSYRMWLAGTFRRGDGVVDGVSLATSRDGRTWTLDERSPVLTIARTAWDSFRIVSLDMEKTDLHGYRMWYVATHQQQREEELAEIGQIGLATSQDGVLWTKYGANPLASELFGSRNVTSISVVSEAGRSGYRIFYTAEPDRTVEQAFGNAAGTEWAPKAGRGVALTVGRPAHTTYLSDWSVPIADFLVVVAAMAAGLSLWSLGKANLETLRQTGQSRWTRAGAAAFFLSFTLMVVFANWRQADEGQVGRRIYNILFLGILFPFGASSMGLLAFYLASAAYRAFRVKTTEAALMIGSAVIVMLGQVPLGQWLTRGLPPSFQVQTWSGWILYIVNGAALRGVAMGAAVGALAVALRLWLSLERTRET